MLALALGGCGDKGDPAAPSSETTPTAAKAPRSATTDRGARRCTRTALLAALLADVDRLAFDVDRVRCKGGFARSRFVARGCTPGQATEVPCGSAKVAAWRLGARRWRLITYADAPTCADIRRFAADFPRSLCR